MEVQFRPFSLVTRMENTDASSITLKDSGGNNIKCNFISVEASGENPDAFFRVGFDTPSSITPVSQFTATSAIVGQTSGVIGGFASVNKGVVEFLLSDFDRPDIIQIQLDQDGECIFFVTYGQIQAGNIRRDNERPTGG